MAHLSISQYLVFSVLMDQVIDFLQRRLHVPKALVSDEGMVGLSFRLPLRCLPACCPCLLTYLFGPSEELMSTN